MEYATLGAIFSLVMGVSLYLNWQARYISQSLVFSSYFFVASILVSYFFPTAFNVAFNAFSLAILIGTYVIAVLGYALIRYLCKKPEAFIERYGTKNAFIRLEYPFLFTKGFEIAFQQLCFATFILLISRTSLALPLLCAISATTLVVLHIPLFFTHGSRWGSFYVLSSFVLGLIFPYLIFFVPAGLAIAFALHLLAYVAMGALLWNLQAE